MTQENQTNLKNNTLEEINQRNNKNTNKSLYKVRVFDPLNSKKTLTYFSTKLDKFDAYLEFYGYLTSSKDISTNDELTELAKNQSLEELILTKPWHQVVDIQTIRKIKDK